MTYYIHVDVPPGSHEYMYSNPHVASRGAVGRATRERSIADSSLTPSRVTVLCPSAKHLIRCLVLIQQSKTRPDVTEKLLTVTYRIKPNTQLTDPALLAQTASLVFVSINSS